MPRLSRERFKAIIGEKCGACGKSNARARAIQSGEMRFLDGEPVGQPVWIYPPDALGDRVYRIECSDCGAARFDRDACPYCEVPGRLARALQGRNGLTPPAECPRCEHPELKWTAAIRMHAQFIEGHPTRRVADAESHEPGFHVLQVDCPGCKQTVGKMEAACAVCGRSRLLRKMN